MLMISEITACVSSLKIILLVVQSYKACYESENDHRKKKKKKKKRRVIRYPYHKKRDHLAGCSKVEWLLCAAKCSRDGMVLPNPDSKQL